MKTYEIIDKKVKIVHEELVDVDTQYDNDMRDLEGATNHIAFLQSEIAKYTSIKQDIGSRIDITRTAAEEVKLERENLKKASEAQKEDVLG